MNELYWVFHPIMIYSEKSHCHTRYSFNQVPTVAVSCKVRYRPSQILEIGSLRISCAELLVLIDMGTSIFHDLIKSLSENILTFEFHISCGNRFLLYAILCDTHTLFFYCGKIMTQSFPVQPYFLQVLFSTTMLFYLVSHCVEGFSYLLYLSSEDLNQIIQNQEVLSNLCEMHSVL